MEYLLKKLHEQDKHTVVSVFPDVLQRLCTSTMPAEHKDNILATLSQFVTLDKQTRNLVKVMLGRLMVEQDMSAAKYCLQGVFQLKSGAELGSSILDTLHQVCVAVPALAEKLEDKEFAKLILVRCLPLNAAGYTPQIVASTRDVIVFLKSMASGCACVNSIQVCTYAGKSKGSVEHVHEE